jgi:hypothetical protein
MQWQIASALDPSDASTCNQVEAETTAVSVFRTKRTADFSSLANPLTALCAANILEVRPHCIEHLLSGWPIDVVCDISAALGWRDLLAQRAPVDVI